MRPDLLNYVFLNGLGVMVRDFERVVNNKCSFMLLGFKKADTSYFSSLSHGLNAFDFEQFITCLSLVFTFYLMRTGKFIVLYDFGSAAEDAFNMRLTWCRRFFFFL